MDRRKVIRINWHNFFPGFTQEDCLAKVLYGLQDEFDFRFVDNPDVLIINCYGQHPLPTGSYSKIGYYTENLPPDLENFDWFFGCQYDDTVGHPKYCKRFYGNINPALESWSIDPTQLVTKDRFCLFLYSTRVGLREGFFRELSRRKFVHAPGKSMHNIDDPELSVRSAGDWHASKLRYMQRYKFVISFENSLADGYFTEKITDGFLSHTVPIYFGDPSIARVYNESAFINAARYVEPPKQPWRLPESRVPYAPFTRDPGFVNKLFGRANDTLRQLDRFVVGHPGFGQLCERVLEVDADLELYNEMLCQQPVRAELYRIRDNYVQQWRQILRSI